MTKNYDDYRAGMLRAAEMARNEFKRAPDAAKGHDCVYMSGYEDACDHLSVVIAQAAVIDSVRIAGPQPDWQYHISLLFPDGIADETLLKIYQVVEHELRAAASSTSKEEEAQGWQPIETAPKDKTVVIVGLLKDGRVWRVSEASFNGLGWYDQGGKACHWRTHWIPLPPGTTPPAPLVSDCGAMTKGDE